MTEAAEVAGLFEQRYDGPPTGVWSAPGRVNLIGEHTDYNGGLCLPIALPLRTYVAAQPREDRRLRVWSRQRDESVQVGLDEVGPGRPAGWAAYVAGVPWALEQGGHPAAGLDLAVDGRVPLGAGLSSSAALECAVAAACVDLAGLDLLASDAGRAELAEVCMRAENEVAQAPTGGLDQSASLRCTAAHALLLDCRDGSAEQVPLDLERHELALLVIDTRAEHTLVESGYGDRRRDCEEAARLLGVSTLREVGLASLDTALAGLPDALVPRVRHVVSEIERVRQTVDLLRRDQVEQVGPLMDASHASLRDDYEVSCEELDVAVDAARLHGALGARMTGGGFGGSAIALVQASEAERVGAGVVAAFAERRLAVPHCFPVVAAAPAGRDA